VPFAVLLEQLVSSIKGATGALILESDGEAVQWHCSTGSELLRLRSAYLVNVLESCRAATTRLKLGKLGHITINYDGARFVAREVNPGYYLLIQLEANTNIASAVYRLEQVLPPARALFDA
jgi:predicted regulator of Ras-like GTPase activity (Roadblock/LC7/MglB family)